MGLVRDGSVRTYEVEDFRYYVTVQYQLCSPSWATLHLNYILKHGSIPVVGVSLRSWLLVSLLVILLFSMHKTSSSQPRVPFLACSECTSSMLGVYGLLFPLSVCHYHSRTNGNFVTCDWGDGAGISSMSVLFPLVVTPARYVVVQF